MTPTALRLLQAIDSASSAAFHLYQGGSDLAKWYKAHAHEHVIKAIAFFIAGCIHLYANRNSIRNTLGSLFVYSYTPEPVEVEEQEQEPTPQLEEQEEIRWDWEFPKPRYTPKQDRLQLLAMTARELREMAGVRRRVSKAQLVDLILA